MAPRNKTTTSAAGGKETLRHFTHPHVLIKLPLHQALASVNSKFTCDGCNLDIPSGNTYYCKQCDFGLHEDCANCPEYLNSSFHPNHQLERVWEGVEDDYGLSRPCDLCGDQVKGLFYKCSSGADEKSYYDDDGDHYFFIHPTCSKLPSQVILKLQSVSDAPDAPCAICRNLVSSSPWSYRTGLPYGLNMHPQCVTLPPEDNHHQVRSTGTSRSAQQQVEDAAADADELAAAMYEAKMSAKTNQFALDLWS